MNILKAVKFPLTLLLIAAMAITMCFTFSGCGSGNKVADFDNEDIGGGLVHESTTELSYANQFQIDYYEGGYRLLSIVDDARYLVVPEGAEDPEGLDSDIKIIHEPFNKIYLVASATMDMFLSMDSLDVVRFTGTKETAWYLEEVIKQMKEGKILYAGKYSAPDYELLLSENCDLCIENTMITHTPDVKEQLEKFGVPVMVDRSSYESEPLGRTEWVKFYGALLGREEAAEAAFKKQEAAYDEVKDEPRTDKTVAFFYITNAGEVNVRASDDYIARMIEEAGGEYIFKDLKNGDSNLGTVTLQMEDFYAAAKDADYLIYNSSIEKQLVSTKELIAKSSLLKDFKAVKEGHVYCTTKNMYQASMELGTLINDFHGVVTDRDDMTFIYKLK